MCPRRLWALIVLLWRAGLRINEARTVTEHDMEPGGGSVLVRHGKGGRRREVGMEAWGWEHLARAPSRDAGRPLLCVIDGPTRGRPGRATLPAPSCGASPRRPVCGTASRPTSCATPTPSSSPTRASRSTSSSDSPVIPTSASPRSICKASTTPNHRHRPRPEGADDPGQYRTPRIGRGPRRRRRSHRHCSRRKGALLSCALAPRP